MSNRHLGIDISKLGRLEATNQMTKNLDLEMNGEVTPLSGTVIFCSRSVIKRSFDQLSQTMTRITLILLTCARNMDLFWLRGSMLQCVSSLDHPK